MYSSGSFPSDQIRRPVVAGQFYPQSPQDLSREVDGFLQAASVETVPGEILGLIAPHAGYLYSGHVAGYAYRLVQGAPFENVVVVAPSHRTAFAGASIYHRGGYQTPLGIVPVNAALAADIMARSDRLNYYPQAHAQEHALEVQLPFLQRALGSFQLVPIVMGDQDMDTCRMLADALAPALQGKNALLVASSDLSHYHSSDQARSLDGIILKAIGAFDADELYRSLRTGQGEACGGGPMVAVMMAAGRMGATGARVLKYADSGDISGDHDQVVGYVAAAIFQLAGRDDNGQHR
jgi:AmmeMemoRadiSam system protein B